MTHDNLRLVDPRLPLCNHFLSEMFPFDVNGKLGRPGCRLPNSLVRPWPSTYPRRMTKRLGRYLAVGLAGVVLLLTGLAWDSVMHASDPSLAAREGIFTWRNPGHALLGLGMGTVMVGLLGASFTALSMATHPVWSRAGVRRALLAGSTALVLTSAAVTSWSSASGHRHAGVEAVHGHGDAELAAPNTHAGGGVHPVHPEGVFAGASSDLDTVSPAAAHDAHPGAAHAGRGGDGHGARPRRHRRARGGTRPLRHPRPRRGRGNAGRRPRARPAPGRGGARPRGGPRATTLPPGRPRPPFRAR